MPGTPISIILSEFHGLLSQVELDLCIIEGSATIFEKVVARGSDGFLPLNSWSAKYGNVVINFEDFCPPSFRMRYSVLVTALRAIALFASQYGYHGMQVEVWNNSWGHVGTGDLGSIIPPKLGVSDGTTVERQQQ